MNRRIIMAVAVLMLCLVITGCSNPDVANKTNGLDSAATTITEKYSWWIGQGEDSSYYANYSQNPGVEYMLTKTWPTESGDVKIELDFMVPVTGSQADNFNTLIATDGYADIMELTYNNTPLVDLYADGIIMDLTPYVEKYMPNYLAFLEANPDLARTSKNLVDGEAKHLQLYTYADGMTAWAGYSYRRDWIVSYGKNPITGERFTGGFTGDPDAIIWDGDGWEDDVVFPSGGSDPIYISDWEWMFDIFTTAMEDMGITDGYCMSLYYPGYMEIGDLVCAFGGGAGHWYINDEGNVAFGASTEDFRVYLQAMNTWYQNGWIDKAFPEHTSDIFYRIDDTKVRQGKVGLWYGTQATHPGGLDLGDEFTTGMVVFPARQPINDMYGGEAQQNKQPYAYYTNSKESKGVAISSKVEGKNLEALFTMLDYRYSVEGSLLSTVGLNQAQYEETKNALYTQEGLTEGSYQAVELDGLTKYSFVKRIKDDGSTLVNAVRSVRIAGLTSLSLVVPDYPPEWVAYPATGRIPDSLKEQLSSDNVKALGKIENNIRDFMNKNVPNFIRGMKDPYSDADWEAFQNALAKYKPADATEVYQALLDSFQ